MTITYGICLGLPCWLSQAFKCQLLESSLRIWITEDLGSHSYIVCHHMAEGLGRCARSNIASLVIRRQWQNVFIRPKRKGEVYILQATVLNELEI